MIYAADRVAELLCHMRAERIEPKRLRSDPLVGPARCPPGAGRRGQATAGPGWRVAPPLVVYDGDGRYTAEIAGDVPRGGADCALTSSGN
ncbi:MAG: hypothetical protein MZV70_63000 [Desulfobacterales bacterium]|nr:hypothetical protein [Desulfobacterales bacterium]